MELDRIRELADISIRRGCGFGLIAIGTASVGASFDAFVAVKLAAICASAMVAILFIKAMQAPTRPYRHTEVWIMLERRHGLPEQRAQQVFGSILRERYMWHATVTATGAGILWFATIALVLFGRH
ncbi:MAG: hypothetical protein L6R19_14470 [Alphaproteobacteria bacterium]|nr:hypothetical protein [Alphaproteobacteria bacterium]